MCSIFHTCDVLKSGSFSKISMPSFLVTGSEADIMSTVFLSSSAAARLCSIAFAEKMLKRWVLLAACRRMICIETWTPWIESRILRIPVFKQVLINMSKVRLDSWIVEHCVEVLSRFCGSVDAYCLALYCYINGTIIICFISLHSWYTLFSSSSQLLRNVQLHVFTKCDDRTDRCWTLWRWVRVIVTEWLT